MTEPIDSIGQVPPARRGPTRRRAGDPAQGDERSAAQSDRTLPVVVAAPSRDDTRSHAEARAKADAVFAAQVMGQGGQKRGLRGGPAVLDHARSAYLETEWSGHADRRPPKGLITRTDI